MSRKNEQFEEMTGLLNKAIPVIKTVLTDFNQSENVPMEIADYQNLLQRFY